MLLRISCLCVCLCFEALTWDGQSPCSSVRVPCITEQLEYVSE